MNCFFTSLRSCLTSLLVVVFSFYSYAQVGIGTATPSSSAALHVSSTSKGVLFPRLTTSQRNAISSPEFGLVVYNSTLDELQVYKKGAETLNISQSSYNMTNSAPNGVYQSFLATASGILGSVLFNATIEPG